MKTKPTQDQTKPRASSSSEAALQLLATADGIAREAAAFLKRHRLPLRFISQQNSGARWFDWRRLKRGVFLNADYDMGQLGTPHLAALVLHEVIHLQQGVLEALSVRGELEAWQAQRAFLDQMVGPTSDTRWRQIQELNPSSCDDLRRARALMKGLGGPGYHIELLPLVPFSEAIRWIVRRLLRVVWPERDSNGLTRAAQSKENLPR